jgi:hypothetical protein
LIDSLIKTPSNKSSLVNFPCSNYLERVILPELNSFKTAITPKEVSRSINVKCMIYFMLILTKFSCPNYLRRNVINKIKGWSLQ